MVEDLHLGRQADRPGQDRLRADCGNCFGLCCVVPAFAASADFAIDKPAGIPCPNLGADFGCGIHDRLRGSGFAGCVVYDCFGAGQQVSQHTFRGQDWHGTPPAGVSGVFPIMRQLHELLWYLREALDRPQAVALHPQLRSASAELERITALPPGDLLTVDAGARRAEVAGLLRRTSALARPEPGPDHANADLIGADLRRADLRQADLRGALLIGAKLQRADLRGADLLGADLRGANLDRADLSGALFVTPSQLEAARGGPLTTLPAGRDRPGHWAA